MAALRGAQIAAERRLKKARRPHPLLKLGQQALAFAKTN